ncbi:MAG: glutamyl-tRNA reductase [Alphaproteobacteria bacterium]|jgi:glutamyl-tRNA reductase
MAERPEDWPALVVVGANHRSAPVALREQLMVGDDEVAMVFEKLRAAGFDQALLMSTCDRVEVHTIHDDPSAVAVAVADVLGRHAGIDASALTAGFYTLEGGAAARHLFAIAASLDSLVIGEPNVLGQLKAAHRVAQASDMMGSELDGLLQAAYGAAKRVRSETAIGERPVSIAAAAVEVSREVHGDLASCAGLVIGLSEMGEMVADKLRSAGLGSLVVTHRTSSRAEPLARALGANVVAFETLPNALAAADVVITCAGLGTYTLSVEAMDEALRQRRRRPVFIIDLAVPRDADPAIEELDGAFVYDSTDLEGVARAGLAEREAVADEAWQIIDERLAAYGQARAMRARAPAIDALRQRFEALRQEVLANAGNSDPDAVTRSLINRLLHDPSEALRDLATDDADAERLLRRLFRLDPNQETKP